jgi:hypothetical protein
MSKLAAFYGWALAWTGLMLSLSFIAALVVAR